MRSTIFLTFYVLLGNLIFFSDFGTGLNLKFGDPCSISDEINVCDLGAGLNCNSNSDKCECEYTWQVYDVERSICLSPLAQTCNHEIFRCVENADCEEDEQLLPICVCAEGSVPVPSSKYCPWGMIVAGHSETGDFRICCSTNHLRNPAARLDQDVKIDQHEIQWIIYIPWNWTSTSDLQCESKVYFFLREKHMNHFSGEICTLTKVWDDHALSTCEQCVTF